ncbi:SAM-dependent methyltransferase [Sinosporangium siamense]|uniref:SAM-dependent methyltransferase n=1 Tax=Sinosporangium siamense TaxID=1367973 RepID=UPI001EF31627|nr:SAM-dependent methyltransferase [Sinosporangium siamense]
MSERLHIPAGINPRVPSVARMYDYYLGGKDHFAADREAAEQFIRLLPGIREIALANRGFLARSVDHAARSGISQFLDIGSGLPTQENVHEVAHRVVPEARVVYVDNDPIVLSHGRALLADSPGTTVVAGDMREPARLFTNPEITTQIDFTRPVAVLMVAMLHFISDHDLVAHIIDVIRGKLVAGSHLIVSHAFEGDADTMTREAGQRIYRATNTGSLTSRGPDDLAALVKDMELLEPGIVPVHAWRPADTEEPVPFDPDKPGILALVARQP